MFKHHMEMQWLSSAEKWKTLIGEAYTENTLNIIVSSGYDVSFIFERFWIQILFQRLAILIEVLVIFLSPSRQIPR
jgi:hypothetical protein